MNYTFSNKVADLKGSAIREMFKLMAKPGIISFAGGAPAPESFPNEALAEISAEILKNQGAAALQYGITEGLPAMVDFVRGLAEKDGLWGSEDDLLITAGGQQGIDLLAKVLLNEGDMVLCENPSFIGALNSFRSYGAKLFGIPCAEDGMDMDQLEEALRSQKNVRLIYTIPTFQNPSGITMSLEKRKRLLELAAQYKVMILEDNPYGDLRFEGEPIATLKSMDTENSVVYVGTFSKTLSPGLRLGYAIGHAPLIQKMTVCKQVSDVHTAVLNQMIAVEYFKRYSFAEHVKEISQLYKHRCHKMLSCMEQEFPSVCTWTKPQGGLFIWATMPEHVDAQDIFKRSVERSVAIVPGNTLMDDMERKCSSFRLNFSTMSDESIEKGIAILGSILREV